MYFFILTFGFALVLKILLYYLLIGILPYCVHIVAAGPKLTAPKLSLHFGVKTEYLLGRNALHRIDYLLWRKRRNALNQKMGMVPIKTYLQKMNLITFLYSKTNPTKCLGNQIIQHITPILNRAYKMIQQQTLVMTLMDMIAHNHKNKNHATPEAEPRGIL